MLGTYSSLFFYKAARLLQKNRFRCRTALTKHAFGYRLAQHGVFSQKNFQGSFFLNRAAVLSGGFKYCASFEKKQFRVKASLFTDEARAIAYQLLSGECSSIFLAVLKSKLIGAPLSCAQVHAIKFALAQHLLARRLVFSSVKQQFSLIFFVFKLGLRRSRRRFNALSKSLSKNKKKRAAAREKRFEFRSRLLRLRHRRYLWRALHGMRKYPRHAQQPFVYFKQTFCLGYSARDFLLCDYLKDIDYFDDRLSVFNYVTFFCCNVYFLLADVNYYLPTTFFDFMIYSVSGICYSAINIQSMSRFCICLSLNYSFIEYFLLKRGRPRFRVKRQQRLTSLQCEVI